LIKDNGRACLADFGLASMMADAIPGYITSWIHGGTVRWMAPEVLDPRNFGLSGSECMPTIESDIFAIGMVIYEVV
jgi:serine/threonine protein kinase